MLMYQINWNKITEFTTHSIMGITGPNYDMVNFTEKVYIICCFRWYFFVFEIFFDPTTPIFSFCKIVLGVKFILKNFKLYEHVNDSTRLSLHAQANFAQNKLAKAIQKG